MEITTSSLEQCSICLDEIEYQNKCLMNCNHSFCKKCIDDYLQRNNKTCPYCRSQLVSYNHNNKDYQFIFINNDEINNDNINLRNQLLVYSNSNRKLVQYGYLTFATLFYFVYNYFSSNYHYHQLLSNYTDIQASLDECNHNQTELYDILNDESRNVILYNPNYDYGQKCLISEYLYDKCFQQNIYY